MYCMPLGRSLVIVKPRYNGHLKTGWEVHLVPIDFEKLHGYLIITTGNLMKVMKLSFFFQLFIDRIGCVLCVSPSKYRSIQEDTEMIQPQPGFELDLDSDAQTRSRQPQMRSESLHWRVIAVVVDRMFFIIHLVVSIAVIIKLLSF